MLHHLSVRSFEDVVYILWRRDTKEADRTGTVLEQRVEEQIIDGGLEGG